MSILSKKFSVKRNFASHLEIHNSEPFECEKCMTKFDFKKYLLTHKANVVIVKKNSLGNLALQDIIV